MRRTQADTNRKGITMLIARRPLLRLWAALALGVVQQPPATAVEPKTLWDPAVPLPKRAEISVLDEVAFHVIKQRRPDTDGCNWTLGVGLAWHHGKLYASHGFNNNQQYYKRGMHKNRRRHCPPRVAGALEGRAQDNVNTVQQAVNRDKPQEDNYLPAHTAGITAEQRHQGAGDGHKKPAGHDSR